MLISLKQNYRPPICNGQGLKERISHTRTCPDVVCTAFPAWNLLLVGTTQRNLTITLPDEPTITVDNIVVAQLLYLLLSNAEARDVFDAVSAKSVLILGKFTPDRKSVLDSIRQELRRYNLFPVLFDFSVPTSRDITGTLLNLAARARFVIADLTDDKIVRWVARDNIFVIVPNLAHT